MSSDTPSDTPKQYYDAEGKPVTLMRLVLTEPAWANNQILDRDRIERELDAARSDLECQGQAYSKALDDLAAANKRLEEVTRVLHSLNNLCASVYLLATQIPHEKAVKITKQIDETYTNEKEGA